LLYLLFTERFTDIKKKMKLQLNSQNPE
jgi:hypothetical protein